MNRSDLHLLVESLKGQVMFIGLPNDFVDVLLIADFLDAAITYRLPKLWSVTNVDITIKSGNTGLEPAKTPLFQELNIYTRISRGQVEVMMDTIVVKKGSVIEPTAHKLLSYLDLKPCPNLIEVKAMYVNFKLVRIKFKIILKSY